MFKDLSKSADDQAGIVANNANIDVEEASVDPEISKIIQSISTVGELTAGKDLEK
jgi:hypothetical protein